MKRIALLAGILSACFVPLANAGCDDKTCESPSMNVSVQSWGKAPDGTPVELYTLSNGKGLKVGVSTFGATVVSIVTPDKNGKMADVVLGFDDPAGYAACSSYQGAAIGRYGNRIAAGRFTLDGVTYQLACNNGANHLHGGNVGFSRSQIHFASTSLVGFSRPAISFR